MVSALILKQVGFIAFTFPGYDRETGRYRTGIASYNAHRKMIGDAIIICKLTRLCRIILHMTYRIDISLVGQPWYYFEQFDLSHYVFELAIPDCSKELL